jgi:hypothetical protein
LNGTKCDGPTITQRWNRSFAKLANPRAAMAPE